MAEPPKPFATRRRGEAYGVGTWRKGGEWREFQTPFFVKIYYVNTYSKLYLVYTPKERSKEAGSQESGAEV